MRCQYRYFGNARLKQSNLLQGRAFFFALGNYY
jgi:hypothetical protein